MIQLEAIAENIKLADPEPSDTIKQLTSKYRLLKDTEEECERIRKEAKKERESLGEQIYDRMIEEGIDKVVTDQGSFAPDKKKECSIIPAHMEDAFAMLEEQGLGASIKRTIHYQTLNKHFREGELIIPKDSPFFKQWEQKVINMRRKNVRV